MFQFFFNDCIPKTGTDHDLILCLGNALKEYGKIKNRFGNRELDAIVTVKEPSSIILNESDTSLANCISNLERSLKIIGFSVFYKKYPIEDNFIVQDSYITNDYSVLVGGVRYNALYPKVVADSGGLLFTLALHEDVKKNRLDIVDAEGNTTIANNLFGENFNTEFVCNLIRQQNDSKLGNYERLLDLVGDHQVSERFKKSFDVLSKQIQDAIVTHFTRAIERRGATKFYADGDLIKDVTPEKEVNIKVFELRLFNPVAYRVYFFERSEKIYLALVAPKPSPKVQGIHIVTAGSIINTLVKMEN